MGTAEKTNRNYAIQQAQGEGFAQEVSRQQLTLSPKNHSLKQEGELLSPTSIHSPNERVKLSQQQPNHMKQVQQQNSEAIHQTPKF